MSARLRIGFAGTPAFAVAALAATCAAGYTVPLVLTQPDRPAGRGLKLQASVVKQFAQAHGLPVLQPPGLKLDGRYAGEALTASQALRAAALDVLVVAAYGLILPQWLIALPRLGCLNIHASLLPRWRGAAPIQRAIEAGDAHTGITIMQMDAGLDTGAILLVGHEAIRADDSSVSLQERLADLGSRLIVAALLAAEKGALQPVPQPAEGVSYAHKLAKTEAAIDWMRPAAEIERRVRAFDPQPGCQFEFEGQMVKLWRAREGGLMTAPPGTVERAAGCMRVACGDGRALDVLELQRPGGRRMGIQALQALR